MQNDRDQSSNDPAPRQDARRRAVRFFAIAAGLLFAIMIALALVTRLEVMNGGFHVNFALALGVAGTILLGVGLMALSFYSDRSGADDAVRGMTDEIWTDDEKAG